MFIISIYFRSAPLNTDRKLSYSNRYILNKELNGAEGTMTERRRWKAEEKLAIIKEVKENGRIVETRRKYSIDPGMYYRWKESYDSFGIDGLKPHYRRMEPGMRKIMKENEKPKSLLAEKELENALLSDALKKKTVRK